MRSRPEAERRTRRPDPIPAARRSAGSRRAPSSACDPKPDQPVSPRSWASSSRSSSRRAFKATPRWPPKPPAIALTANIASNATAARTSAGPPRKPSAPATAIVATGTRATKAPQRWGRAGVANVATKNPRHTRDISQVPNKANHCAGAQIAVSPPMMGMQRPLSTRHNTKASNTPSARRTRPSLPTRGWRCAHLSNNLPHLKQSGSASLHERGFDWPGG
jgi:hypothetical protein